MSYQFTEAQRRFVFDTIERLRHSAKVNADALFACVEGFDAYQVVLRDIAHLKESGVVAVQSFQAISGEVEFSVRSFDDQQIGPTASYQSFSEAVVFADVFVRSVADALRKSETQERSTSSMSPPHFPSSQDTQLIYSFNEALGRIAEVPCSTDLKPLGANSVAAGFSLLTKGVPIILGSIVLSQEQTGGIMGSVRGYDGARIMEPTHFKGTAEFFEEALPYFSGAARALGKFNKGQTLVGRLRRAIGL